MFFIIFYINWIVLLFIFFSFLVLHTWLIKIFVFFTIRVKDILILYVMLFSEKSVCALNNFFFNFIVNNQFEIWKGNVWHILFFLRNDLIRINLKVKFQIFFLITLQSQVCNFSPVFHGLFRIKLAYDLIQYIFFW